MATVDERVKKIIAEQLGVEEDEVTSEASFVEDLGADSLDTVELVMALEEEFGIEIPDEDAEKILTVGKLSITSRKKPSLLDASMSDRAKRRIVVTGLGLVTPLGTGVDKTWKAICAGQSGIGRITKFDPTGYDAQIAGEVKDFDPAQFIEKKDIKKMDAFIHYAVGAAQLAVDDAGLKVSPEEATKVGVYIGSGIGGLGSIEHYHTVLKDKGPGRVSPFFIPMTIINLASGQVAIRLGAKGPNSCAVTACATGNHCIGDAYQADSAGRCRRDGRRRCRSGDHDPRRSRLCSLESALVP